MVAVALWHSLRWSIVDAVWYAPDGSAACRTAMGACWAVIAEKYRVILFGTYPYDQQWRGVQSRWYPCGDRIKGLHGPPVGCQNR